MKNTIEYISGMKLRKGYDKYIQKTIEYMNLDVNELDNNNSIKIVKFINSSNSKLSDSYWILRSNFTESEYKIEQYKYISNFVESSYNKSNRINIHRKFRKKYNGMGYSGYVTFDDVKYFCRSKSEFIYISYLKKMYSDKSYDIKYENCIFYIDNESYKPDYFIYNNNIVR